MLRIPSLIDQAKVVKTYRDYMVEVNGVPSDAFGEDFDKKLEQALTSGDKKRVLITGVRDVAQTAVHISDSEESKNFFSFFKNRIGKNLFEVISSPEDEAMKIFERNKIKSQSEARMLEAYLELYSDEQDNSASISLALTLLDDFDQGK